MSERVFCFLQQRDWKMTLTPKQELFCQEYIIDLNATQASIRAGYSEKTATTQGPRLLENVGVRERINELQAARSERTEITADYVLRTIQETIERCKQAVPVMEHCPFEKKLVPTGEYKFEHNGVLKGCELLGKHLKLFTEKHELTGKDGAPLGSILKEIDGSSAGLPKS
jgi:phage terminase small subunit